MKSRIDDLEQELKPLLLTCKIAFVASVCERLWPNYVAFSREEGWGNPAILRVALEEIWNSVKRHSFDETRINDLIERCENAAPDTEDFRSPITSAALDASVAIVTTLRFCLDGDAKRVVEVANLALDTIDLDVQQRDNLELRSSV